MAKAGEDRETIFARMARKSRGGKVDARDKENGSDGVRRLFPGKNCSDSAKGRIESANDETPNKIHKNIHTT
jgi:hypothetical protein